MFALICEKFNRKYANYITNVKVFYFSCGHHDTFLLYCTNQVTFKWIVLSFLNMVPLFSFRIGDILTNIIAAIWGFSGKHLDEIRLDIFLGKEGCFVTGTYGGWSHVL